MKDAKKETGSKLWIVTSSYLDIKSPLNQGSANFSRWGPDFDFLDLPGPKREKKVLASNLSLIFSLKIVAISKKKVFTSI